MKLENQVCDLEFSKKLKELGVKQESLFYWTELNGESFLMIVKDFEGESIPKGREDKFISAFTLAELGEKMVTGDRYGVKFKTYCDAGGMLWLELSYTENYKISETQMFYGDTEADSRAKMLIYLIENNIIKI